MMRPSVFCIALVCLSAAQGQLLRAVEDSSPLEEKARYLQQDLLEKHWLDGLYVSIVPSPAAAAKLQHTVDEPGNVIHAGVWTGRYLAGVGYQYAVTRDPWVRQHGGQILQALRTLQEVTGKPGLLARGYVKGHGPVMDWERDGADSKEWHQGQGAYAGYRWYGDVSVDNFNAVLYGYAIYYDLAADDEQKQFIARDVDRLMTHLLSNHCRIVDVDNEVTQWGHVGFDPDPARDEYYTQLFRRRPVFGGAANVERLPLRASLMLLPDLLIADHITGDPRYREFYRRVIARWKNNPEDARFRQPFSLERLARVNHSSEGQAYEAVFNLVRYERDPELLAIYRPWVSGLWEMNWMEGNSLFAYMTLALLPECYEPPEPGRARPVSSDVPHAAEGLRLAGETLAHYPVDRVLRPVMNSRRQDIELNPHADRGGQKQAAKPLPINQRPLDNEYAWKGNPYQLDGWFKPALVAISYSCDDPQVGWFVDATGRIYRTLDGGQSWQNASSGLMGAAVQNLVASDSRTHVIWAQTSAGALISRDGGLSWRPATEEVPPFPAATVGQWLKLSDSLQLRVNSAGQLERTADSGQTVELAMEGWRIPIAQSLFLVQGAAIASGPGGAYRTTDGHHWEELKLWREDETGAADFLHAYWMGRYYGFVPADRK